METNTTEPDWHRAAPNADETFCGMTLNDLLNPVRLASRPHTATCSPCIQAEADG